jgi:ferredoxin
VTARHLPPAPPPPARVDERDVMFARMARTPGTAAYDDYYARRPERRAADDHLRGRPPLLAPGGACYDAEVCGQAERLFRAIDEFVPDARDVDAWAARLRSGDDPGAVVRAGLLARGALAAGVAALDPSFVYTHKGRFDADYGQPIHLPHPTAIVFLVEMDFGAMQHAPAAPVIAESARQYLRAAELALTLAAALRAAGFDARAHYDAHYDVILPPLAVAAGLGEMGRHNILVADRAGTRVRIGAVTTNRLLPADQPVSLGVERFCRACLKCATNCPSHALSHGDPDVTRGAPLWPTHVERCYGYWRAVGTDCGVCMAVCPFSHPDTRLHRLVRAALRRAPWLARFARWWDDRLYGRTWDEHARRQPRKSIPD